MKTPTPPIHKIVEEQVQRWQLLHREEERKKRDFVVTVSREPGSGGSLVARSVAECLGIDFFHQQVIHEMANSAKVSRKIAQTLDERGLSMIEDWISAVVSERHLWPDQYLKHLLKVIGTIAGHGRAVLVGRGANFLIPREKRFSVRVVAPAEARVRHMMEDFGLTADEAKSRIVKTESERRAFIRKYFHADIADPLHYDLVINTGSIDIETAAETVCHMLKRLK